MAGTDEDEGLEVEETRINSMKAAPSAHSGPLPAYLKVSLTVLEGADAGLEIAVTNVPLILGRGQFADVRLRDNRQSRLHAIIMFTSNEFRIVDNASSNGTFLNGSQVKEYRLRDGDKLLIGETLLVFKLARATLA